jgi:hypothetical protein
VSRCVVLPRHGHLSVKDLKTKPFAGKSSPGDALLDQIVKQIRPAEDFYGAINSHWLKRRKLHDSEIIVSAFSVIGDVCTKFL